MKKIVTLCMTAALILSSCSSKEKEEQLRQAQAIAEASRQELVDAITDRDQLLNLVNEISSGMDEIKRLENILTVSNANNETLDQRQQLQTDIAAIQKALQDRRTRLEELEKKLANSNTSNADLRQTIANLRVQIDSQTQEITNLRSSLKKAKEEIGVLGQQVDSLNESVNNVTTERNEVQEQNAKLTNELNTCFYAIGNKNELKQHKIIETAFLRKTKILQGDFDQSFFTTADKRNLTSIDLNSDKAEILTNQPADSYTIEEIDGRKILKITNTDLFWSMSNYLVIKID